MPHALQGATQKVVRATKHLHDLDEERGMWIRRRPYGLIEKPDTEPETFYFELQEIRSPPDIFGVIVGDYVHSLRSALDHLAWQLVLLNRGGKPPPRHKWQEIFFPVNNSLREFLERPCIPHFTLEQIAFMERFQPYHGGEKPEALRDLHDFWNADKHRVINSTVVRLSEQGPVWMTKPDASVAKTWFNSTIPFQPEAKICGYRIVKPGPDTKVEVAELPVDIAFGESRRLIHQLPALHYLVSEILQEALIRFPAPIGLA